MTAPVPPRLGGQPPGQYQAGDAARIAPAPDLTPGGVPLRPLGVGDILSGAVTLIRRDPGPILVFAAVLAAVYSVAERLLVNFYTPYIQARALPANQPLTPAQQQAYLVAAGGLLGLEILVLLVLVIYKVFFWNLFAGVVAYPVGTAVLGGKPRLKESLRRGRLGTVLVISLAELLTFAGAWVVAGAIVAGLAAAGLGPLAILAGILGGVAALVGMVLVMVRWSAATAAAVLERLGPAAALRRSWRLTRGRYWRTFGIVSLAGLVTVIAADVLVLPYNALVYVVRYLGGTSGFSNTNLVGWRVAETVVTILATLPTVPVVAGAMILSYANLRIRKEGLDLVLQQDGQPGGDVLARWRQPDWPARPW